MLKKIIVGLIAFSFLLGGCSKKPIFLPVEEEKTIVVERPAISEIKKLSDLKVMIENEIQSGKGFNYSETISANGMSIYSFYSEDSKNNKSFRQSIIMGEEGGLVKYEIEEAGQFSSYNVDAKKFIDTDATELNNAGTSVRLQLVDYLRDDLQVEITEQSEDTLKMDVSGLEINDAGTVFNRLSISYLEKDNGSVIFYLFSDTGTAMGFSISFVESGYDISESLRDVEAITGE